MVLKMIRWKRGGRVKKGLGSGWIVLPEQAGTSVTGRSPLFGHRPMRNTFLRTALTQPNAK